MNIVVASDQNYLPHLETLIVSIGENNKLVDDIHIHIFEGGISDKAKEHIEQYRVRYINMNFTFYDMTEAKIAELLGGEISKDRSLATYARIFIPEMINSDRALYFDVDAIVLADLRELYATEMEGYAIAGVLDTNPIARHRNVGLNDSNIYINAGMMLWNLEMCRKIDFVQCCIDFIAAYNGNVDAMDQGTINGVLGCNEMIKVVHPKYNVLTSFFQLDREDVLNIYGLRDFYSDELIREARDYPVFVHFTPNMTTRPWIKNCKHPLKKEYWKYRSTTRYYKKQLKKDMRSYSLRVLGWIYRNLPSNVYVKFIKKFR